MSEKTEKAEKAEKAVAGESTPAGGMTLSAEQFTQLLTAIGSTGGGLTADALEKILAAQGAAVASGMRKALKPENPRAPMISAFNPQGDRDHPRPTLKCKMFLRAYPIDGTTETVEELTLLNMLTPGIYWITRQDGMKVKMPVVADENSAGEVERMLILLPMEEDHKQGYPPFSVLLREALGLGLPDAAAQQAELERLRAEVAVLRSQQPALA